MKKSEIKVGLRVSAYAPKNAIRELGWTDADGARQRSRYAQVGGAVPTKHLFDGDRQRGEIVELDAPIAEQLGPYGTHVVVKNDGVLVRLDGEKRLVCLTTRQLLEDEATYVKRVELYKATTVRHHEEARTRDTEVRTKIERVESLLAARGVTRDAIRREAARVEQSEYIRRATVHLTLDEVIELLGEVA